MQPFQRENFLIVAGLNAIPPSAVLLPAEISGAARGFRASGALDGGIPASRHAF